MKARPLVATLMSWGLIVPLARAESAPAPLATTSHERASTPSRSVVALALEAGFGAPLGILGVALELRPVSWLSASAGAGIGFDGPQLGLMGRVEFDIPVYFGMGTSMGPFRRNLCKDFAHLFPADSNGPCKEPLLTWDRAKWLNLEIGYSTGVTEAIRFRAFIGGAVLLNRTPDACTLNNTENDCAITDEHSPSQVVYVGISAAWPP